MAGVSAKHKDNLSYLCVLFGIVLESFNLGAESGFQIPQFDA